MIVGVLFIFTYVRDAVHGFGRSIKKFILPTFRLQHNLLALLCVAFTILVLLLGVGVMVIVFNEGYGFVTALYFAVYTATVRLYGCAWYSTAHYPS